MLDGKVKQRKVMERARSLTKRSVTVPQSRSKMAEKLSKIADDMRGKVYASALENSACGCFEYQSGWILVSIFRTGEAEVSVFHYNKHESPALEQAIKESMPDWYEVKAEAEKDMR